MGRVAVVSDIHGNLTAWEAVLADIATVGVDSIYCLGDLVGKGPQGAEVIDSCRRTCAEVVRGNWDEAVAAGAPGQPRLASWTREQLRPDQLAYLRDLRNCLDVTISGRLVRMFHASAVGVDHRVFSEGPEAELDAMFANTPFTGFEHPEPTVVGYGDVHTTFLLPVGQKTLFNVGSVGNALDETTASYGLLEGTLHSNDPSAFSISFRRVPYDVEAAIAIAREVDMPGAQAYAIELRTGIYRRDHEARGLTAGF
jgi:predicted phosphodiesterase